MRQKLFHWMVAACLVLSVSACLTIPAAAKAGKTGTNKKDKKADTYDGTVVNATKLLLIIDVGTDKSKIVSLKLTNDTVITGDLVKGAKVSATASAGTATKVDVAGATKTDNK